MRKFQRGTEPEFLAQNWEAWGEEWERRKASNPKAAFNWREHGGEAVNQKLLPPLKLQTQGHCSFCDYFPVSPPSIDTIEHFQPKSTFPRKAYHWPNLYFCCMHCQQKGGEFDPNLLRPDAGDYKFEHYFRWDYTLGTIEVNERASPADQERARVTIRIYRLNEGHASLRKRTQRLRDKLPDEPVDEFPYRHYL